MHGLRTLERFIERLFERPAARLFHARLQPVQILRRVERAMEAERLSGPDRTLVPNRLRVRLHPSDFESIAGFAETLAGELAEGALRFARAHRYALVDRPRVELTVDEAVEPGDVEVDATFADAAAGEAGVGVAEDVRTSGIGRVTEDTLVFEVPRVVAPLAVLREVRADGRERRVRVDGSVLTIGRARDNGLVLDDPLVSRHHARLQARRGTLVLTDLGSTNGTRVNGAPIREVVLGEGDRIELGGTVLVVEALLAA